MVLENLTPSIVWDIFEHVLAATPRESKKEARIRSTIKEWVRKISIEHGINVQVLEDSIGNILLKVPSTPGMGSCPTIMLQCHLDMVCETDRPEGFDFDTQPIPVMIEDNGEWVTANGTTLGADNGIGVALALALIIDDTAVHGPLEILLTVDEETGLSGAFGLDVDLFNPTSRLLLNLDSEDFGVITIGSAGGGSIEFNRTLYFRESSSEYIYLTISVNGLRGGHSGADIHLHRANANVLVARLLARIVNDHKIVLVSWNGGSKHNAITRESFAKIGVPRESIGAVREALNDERDNIIKYYKNAGANNEPLEPDIKIIFSEVSADKYLSPDETFQIVSTINAIPHGPKTFSPQIPELVETSCNLAIIRTEEDSLVVKISARSNVDAELAAFRRSIGDVGRLGNWDVYMSPSYPGWFPNPSSPFLKFVKDQYTKLVDESVKIEAIHAGLECGIIGAKIPGMQMVSIGPTIRNPHTPDERVNIESVDMTYSFLKSLLRELPSAGF